MDMEANLYELEDTSSHYWLPQTNNKKDYLYYLDSIGCFDCKPGYHIDRHNFNNYLLIVMLSGSLSYTTLNSTGIVLPGYALLLDCHLPHNFKANGKCSFMFIHYSGAHSKPIYSAIESSTGVLLYLKKPEVVCDSIRTLLNRLSEGEHLDKLQTSQTIYSILLQLLSADPARNEYDTGDQFINQALEYIDQHLSERISVQEIAESIGYSEGYFTQKFLQVTSVTPYQLVLNSRIERAQQLLQVTTLSIQEIAAQTGFGSVSNFSHTFKKVLGCTPREFRERPM